MIMIQT